MSKIIKNFNEITTEIQEINNVIKTVDKLKTLLIPYNLGYNKIRIGPPSDGGYVLYKEPTDTSNTVYSLGVGGIWGADLQFAEMNKKVFMYDVNDFHYSHRNMIFKKIFVTSEIMDDELKNVTDNNLLLCMDIEGSEFELITNMKTENLTKFSQISFEIHFVWSRKNDLLFPMLERLNEHFDLFHIHSNNYGHILNNMPDVFELSYLRKDLSKQKNKESLIYPIRGLDYPNNPTRLDHLLDWWIY
jgi:hypothetical protein